MELIIEEISRGHKLLGRHKFTQRQVSIGRGYHNDIILDDPHVCADHLNFEFDGEHWRVSDDNSINGSFVGKDQIPAEQHILQSGDVITFGKSQIRVLFPHHPVEESVVFSRFESFIDLARNPTLIVASLLMFICIGGFMVYLQNANETSPSQIFVGALTMTLILSLWPGAVSIVSHLTKHEARFFSQLGMCFIFFNLMWVSDFVQQFVNFNLSSSGALVSLIVLVPVALSFCMFWFNCEIGFHMSQRRKLVVSAAIAVVLFGGSFLLDLSRKPEFNARPNYNATLMSPTFLVHSGSSVDEFVEQSADLFEKAKKAALKKDD